MDFLESGVFGKNMAMLGLGDIVLPGVFIALLIRYDLRYVSRRNIQNMNTSFFCYHHTVTVSPCISLVAWFILVYGENLNARF